MILINFYADYSVDVLEGSENYNRVCSRSHAAEAIKSESDINTVVNYLIRAERWRDLLLFVMGINFGFRCGDLLSLRIGDVVDASGRIVRSFKIKEEKTGKIRPAAMNPAVVNALRLFLENVYGDQPVDRNAYLFTSQSRNASGAQPVPLTVRSVERLLKEIVNDRCHIPVHASTHMMRKTFAYHFLMKAPDRSRALELLSMQLNHTSVAYTLRYIGITQDEILQTCFNIELGNTTGAKSELPNVVDLNVYRHSVEEA